MSHTT